MTLTNLVAGEALVSTAGATFNSKDVLGANQVTVNSVNLANGAGGLASNYTLAAGGTALAGITAKALTYTTAAVGKAYDGNNTAAATLNFTNLVAGEALVSTAGATFNSKNVMSANQVTVNSVSLANGAGGLASNYAAAAGGTALANIIARNLTVGVTGMNKVYDGTTAATVGYTDNRLASDVLMFTSNARFADKNAANAKAVTVTNIALGGTDSGNYSANGTANTMANITPMALTITASNDSQVVSNSPYAGGKGVSYSALATGDTLAGAVAGNLNYGGTSQGAATVGSYVITPGGLTAASNNYTLGFASGVLNLTAGNATVAALGDTSKGAAYDAALNFVAGVSPMFNGPGGMGNAAPTFAANDEP